MSLVNLIKNSIKLEFVTENNWYVEPRENSEFGGFTVWLDSSSRNLPHASRIKVYPPGQSTSSGDYFSVELKTLTVTNQQTSKKLSKYNTKLKLLIEFLSREAIHEALLNVNDVEDCQLTPEILSQALNDLARGWRHGSKDKYDSDLAVINAHARRNGIVYDPVPLDELF